MNTSRINKSAYWTPALCNGNRHFDHNLAEITLNFVKSPHLQIEPTTSCILSPSPLIVRGSQVPEQLASSVWTSAQYEGLPFNMKIWSQISGVPSNMQIPPSQRKTEQKSAPLRLSGTVAGMSPFRSGPSGPSAPLRHASHGSRKSPFRSFLFRFPLWLRNLHIGLQHLQIGSKSSYWIPAPSYWAPAPDSGLQIAPELFNPLLKSCCFVMKACKPTQLSQIRC